MGFCALLIFVISFFDKIGDILENDPDTSLVLLYFATSMPHPLMQIVPIVTMLAVLFSIGGLARYNEIVALVTSGVHTLRAAAPIIAAGFVIVGVWFYLNENYIPQLQAAAQRYELLLEGKDLQMELTQRQVVARGHGNRIYAMRRFDQVQKEMTRPVVIDTYDDGVTVLRKIEADVAVHSTVETTSGEVLWYFASPRLWAYNTDGRVLAYQSFPIIVPIPLEKDLLQILSLDREPEEMNFRQLQEHIEQQKIRQLPVYGFETDLLIKVMFPLGIILVLLIGFALAVRVRAGTAMAIFGSGVLWAFGYYVCTAVLQALGRSGRVPPELAASLPLIIFSVFAVYQLRRSYRWLA